MRLNAETYDIQRIDQKIRQTIDVWLASDNHNTTQEPLNDQQYIRILLTHYFDGFLQHSCKK